jgi:hypothetical protein
MLDQDLQADPKANLLKARKVDAANRAEAAPGNLAPGGGSALAGDLADLETAWVSPSQERRAFSENVAGMGSAAMGAFGAQADQCRAEAKAEPEEVACDDVDLEWKTDEARIDARMSGPYYPGSY